MHVCVPTLVQLINFHDNIAISNQFLQKRVIAFSNSIYITNIVIDCLYWVNVHKTMTSRLGKQQLLRFYILSILQLYILIITLIAAIFIGFENWTVLANAALWKGFNCSSMSECFLVCMMLAIYDKVSVCLDVLKISHCLYYWVLYLN